MNCSICISNMCDVIDICGAQKLRELCSNAVLHMYQYAQKLFILKYKSNAFKMLFAVLYKVKQESEM